MSFSEKSKPEKAGVTEAPLAMSASRDQVLDYLPDYGKPWYRVSHLLKLNLLLFVPMLSSTTNGFDGSMLNGLQSVSLWQEFFNYPSGETLGCLANGTVFGGILAFPFAAQVSDRWGRKVGVWFGSLVCVIGAVLQGASVSYAMFLISRIVLGFGTVFAVVASPSLISELSYPTHRGVATTVYNTQWYTGAVLAGWITYGCYFWDGSDWSWRMPSIMQGALPLVQLILTPFIPESPRFLISKGKYDKARQVLLKWHAGGDEALGGKLIDFEMAEIISAIEGEKLQAKASYLDFFKTQANRHRLAIITFVPVTMQLCGNGLVSYYLHYVLDSIGITSEERQLVINGGLMIYNLGTAILAAFVVGSLPRRLTFLVGVGSMCVAYVVWTVLSAINQQRNFEQPALGQGVLAMIFLFYAAYNGALNGLPYLYMTEILPFRLRAKGLSWANLVIQVVLVYNGFVNPIAMEAIDWKYYIVYCCLIAVEFTVIFFLFPETKGYTLEEVATVFGDAVEEMVNEKRAHDYVEREL